MNKENLNLAPGSGAEDTKSDKAAKAKKVAGKAAQFAAAAGAGVAGKMGGSFIHLDLAAKRGVVGSGGRGVL